MKHYLWIVGVLAAFAVGLVWLMMQAGEDILRLSREGAEIETASAIGFAVCALAVWTRAETSAVTKAMVSVLMLVFTARELDLDKSLFTRGLFKSTQYLKDDVPLIEKLVSGAILLGILACLLGLIYRERHVLMSGLRQWHAGMVALAVTVLFAVVAKSFDGIARKLEPFGIDVPDYLSVSLQGVEEIMELTIMALLLTAILVPWQGSSGGQRLRMTVHGDDLTRDAPRSG